MNHRLSLPATLAAFLLFVPARALADMTKVQCIDANTAGQNFRRDGKFATARERLRSCADPACPAMVRDDCTRRLDDLDRAQPTIAFQVEDARGADLTDVKVSMDGQPFADRLTGTALAVDVGEHVFTFAVHGRAPVTRKLVITEGEKARRERVVMGATSPETGAPAPIPSSAAAPGADEPARAGFDASAAPAGGGGGSRKLWGVLVGGAGVAGLAVGGVFGALTLGEKSQQENVCARPCSATNHAQAENDHSTGMTDSTVSTVAFIAGGALLAAGALLLLLPDHPSNQMAATRMFVIPTLVSGGAGVVWRGSL